MVAFLAPIAVVVTSSIASRHGSCSPQTPSRRNLASLESCFIRSPASSFFGTEPRFVAATRFARSFESTFGLFVYNSLSLTPENVETVLDEVRPYLIADGGNVALAEIEGPVVKLKLQGACGTCPSSTMTMKMGIEAKLKERIPEIVEVVSLNGTEGLELTEENVDSVLEGIRPFLSSEGSTIKVVKIENKVLTLEFAGGASSLMSLKMEIMRRVQEKVPAVSRIIWA